MPFSFEFIDQKVLFLLDYLCTDTVYFRMKWTTFEFITQLKASRALSSLTLLSSYFLKKFSYRFLPKILLKKNS